MRVSSALVLLASLLPLTVEANYSKYSASSKHSTHSTSSKNSTTSRHSTTTRPTATTSPAACAVVSSLSAAQVLASPSAIPIVDAALAYECLNSVALNKTAAIEFVDAVEPYLLWQSDLAYLKNPPPGYFYPPHDVLGKLASIRANLVANKYRNEYTFQEDLYAVFTLAHDGHFILYPDLLTKAFEWGRRVPLVSISRDGVETPKIYSYEDVVNSPSTAPELLKVDGIDASTYIQNFAYTAAFNQDADAAYNTMFFEKAFEAGGVGTGYFSIGGRVRYIYPSATTSFAWSNGTTITSTNIAFVNGNFAGVVDGPSFYNRFCAPAPIAPAAAAAAASPAVPASAASTGPLGYPPAVISTNDSVVSGYYLDAPGFEDVAVLSILAMESESTAEFQAVVQDFIADAKAAGKTKMVIDLSANPGGYILQGYDLFRQFFPHTVQTDYTRFRENPAFVDIAKIFSGAIPADYDPATASDETIQFYESWFNYRYDYNLTEQPFKTFDDKFAPHIHAGDPYTNLVRWNLNDPLTTINSTYGFGIEISGYGTRANLTQPFAAEDIILVHDGYCASTCIIFSEFMIHDGGVKTVAMGGRPNNDKIQGMGGVKGAQSFSWSDILIEAQASLPLASPAEAAVLNQLTSLPIQRSSANSVNLRDAILPDNLNDGIPAQFVAEEANCRLFYTAPMITDVTKLWETVAKTAWGGGKCVAGSLGNYKRDTEESGVVAKRATTTETKRAVFERETVTKNAFWTKRFGKKVIL